jgi:hypothetical protein
MYLNFKYTFEIELPPEQIKYFDFLTKNYDIIYEKYKFESNFYQGKIAVIFSFSEKDYYYIKPLHKIIDNKIIIIGRDNHPPDVYFACLQETLIKFNSDKEFVFFIEKYMGGYDTACKVKISKSFYEEKPISEDLLIYI